MRAIPSLNLYMRIQHAFNNSIIMIKTVLEEATLQQLLFRLHFLYSELADGDTNNRRHLKLFETTSQPQINNSFRKPTKKRKTTVNYLALMFKILDTHKPC